MPVRGFFAVEGRDSTNRETAGNLRDSAGSRVSVDHQSPARPDLSFSPVMQSVFHPGGSKVRTTARLVERYSPNLSLSPVEPWRTRSAVSTMARDEHGCCRETSDRMSEEFLWKTGRWRVAADCRSDFANNPQCRKWRMPVKIIAMPCSLQAAMTSSSFLEPPG